jgi:hypothetical protein
MGISTKNYFQRFLVLFCIWHFLFWTDMVDYKCVWAHRTLPGSELTLARSLSFAGTGEA